MTAARWTGLLARAACLEAARWSDLANLPQRGQ